MAKLIKNPDGSISLAHEEGSAEDEKYKAEKQAHETVKKIKKSKKDFKSLSQEEKDQLLEFLLIKHDLI